MPNKTKLGLTVIVLAGLVWAFSLSLTPSQAPNAIFSTITGQRIALQDLRGKPVLVTFWATDCPACINEIPDLQALYRDFHPQGLEIIAINMYYDPPSHIVAMSDAKQLPYPVALDSHNEHALAFGNVYLTPTTFLISPDGLIIKRYTGRFDLSELTARLKPYLKG